MSGVGSTNCSLPLGFKVALVVVRWLTARRLIFDAIHRLEEWSGNSSLRGATHFTYGGLLSVISGLFSL